MGVLGHESGGDLYSAGPPVMQASRRPKFRIQRGFIAGLYDHEIERFFSAIERIRVTRLAEQRRSLAEERAASARLWAAPAAVVVSSSEAIA